MEERKHKKQAKKLQKFIGEFDSANAHRVLYAIATWNRNRNSGGRLRFLYLTMLSMTPENFGTKEIKSYDNLADFFLRMIEILPNFGPLEESIPGDWGEIAFFKDRRFYKFLYGSDICWAYDQAHSFLSIAGAVEERCIEVVGRNPVDEFETILELIDASIEGLGSNSKDDDSIEVGYLETPSREFWAEVCSFLPHSIEYLAEGFVRPFTQECGQIEESVVLSNSRFQSILYEGSKLDFVFTKSNDQIYPLPPRWILSSFIQHWSALINSNIDQLKSPPMPLQIGIGLKASSYARERMSQDEVFECVSSVSLSGKADKYIFPLVFCARETLIFCSFTKPYRNQEDLDKQLSAIQDGIREAERNFKPEIALALHLRGQGIKVSNSDSWRVKHLVIIPNISPSPTVMRLSVNFPAKVVTQEQLFGVIDSCKNVRELVDFLDYEKKLPFGTPLNSLLDKFGSFKASRGIIIEGATEPTHVFFDVNWGDNYRFEHLLKFWTSYPRVPWQQNPSSWILHQHSGKTIRMENKTHIGFGMMGKVGKKWILTNSPLDLSDRETTMFIDALLQCVQDYLQRCEHILTEHRFFQSGRDLHICLFSKKQIQGKEDFDHLRHLVPNAQPWITESGLADRGLWGIRVCIDDDQAREKFMGQKNSSSEVEFVMVILTEVNRIVRDDETISKVFDYLDSIVSKKPSYTVYQIKKTGSVPSDYVIVKPADKHFKLARKYIAQVAKKLEINPGRYSGEEAKKVIDSLIAEVSQSIGELIRKFNFHQLLQLLVTNIESIALENELLEANFESVPDRQVEYDYIHHEAERAENYRRFHKHLRYLIERTVLEDSSSREEPSSEDLKLLIAYANWFYVFAESGDNIHHGLSDVEIEINDNYLVDNHLSSELQGKQSAFAKHLEAKRLHEIGNYEDELKHPREVVAYIEEVDDAFIQDFGFGIKDIVSIATILSDWGYISGTGEAFFYRETRDKILEVSKDHLDESTTVERLGLALDFLVMNKEALLKIVGSEIPAKSLPIWEYYKRHTRYTIRPLISIDGEIFWGPGSAHRASVIWFNGVTKNKLPVNPERPNILRILNNEKKLIEDALEKKAHEIVLRHTRLTEPNVQLHRRNKKAGHPVDEYDVLAYFPECNMLLSIETKHIHNVYCLKDARSLKEELFGKESLDQSYVGKTMRRHNYLIEHWVKVAATMGWQINAVPKVKSIFVSKYSYWWTYSPPIDVPISFTVIDELNEMIHELIKV